MGIATAGLAGGLLAVLIVIALQASGLLPGPGGAAIDQARELGDQMMAIDRRVAALESMNESMPGAGQFDELAGRVGALEAARARAGSEVEVMQSALAGLSDRVGSADPASAKRAVDALTQRVARLETGGAASGDTAEPGAPGPVSDQVNQLTERVDALERRMTALSAAPETQSERAALAIAIGSLRRAAAESAPFAPDLAMIAALGVEPNTVAELQPLATEGTPSRAELASEFPAVADAILAATDAIDPNAGFFARIGSNLRGLVSVRPVGPIEGPTPVAIVSRMQAAVDKGDLAAALAERASLPEAGRAASTDWAGAAESRVKVDGLVEKIAAAVAMPATE